MIDELIATGAIRIAQKESSSFVECHHERCFIHTSQDMLDVLSWGAERGTDLYLFEDINFTPEFYDLSTGLAGEILQKCSNYRVKVAIVGSFSGVTSKRFRELMTESNRGSHVRFVQRHDEAVNWLVDSGAGP